MLQRGPGCEARSVMRLACSSLCVGCCFNEVRAAKPGVSRGAFDNQQTRRRASTRSGLRSPECPPRCRTEWPPWHWWLQRGPGCEARSVAAVPFPSGPMPPGFNEVRAAKPGVSQFTGDWSEPALTALQRGPGCEARSVASRIQPVLDDCGSFNEVRAAKPGVSSRSANRRAMPSLASTRSGLRSPECRGSVCAPGGSG